jgi:hypothetical protein
MFDLAAPAFLSLHIIEGYTLLMSSPEKIPDSANIATHLSNNIPPGAGHSLKIPEHYTFKPTVWNNSWHSADKGIRLVAYY